MKLDRKINDELDYLGTVEDLSPVDDYYAKQERLLQACVAAVALLLALVLIVLLAVYQ